MGTFGRDDAPKKESVNMKRKVLIVGAGVAGLTLALSLRRLTENTNIDIEPILIEAAETFPESSGHGLLSQQAVRFLLELGLGARLGKILRPVVSLDLSGQEQVLPFDDAPALSAVRWSDLHRLLFLSLIEPMDTCDLLLAPASNSQLNSDIEGDDADLAQGHWFEQLKERLEPIIRFKTQVIAIRISEATGAVTAVFNNGLVESGAMIVVADGLHSFCRKLLAGDSPDMFAGAAVITGIANVFMPPVDMPTELEDGRGIEKVDRESLLTFCPEGTGKTVSANGLTFGVINIGNGMLGWNLIVSQTQQGQQVEQFLTAKKRSEFSKALANSRKPSSLHVDAQAEKGNKRTSIIGNAFAFDELLESQKESVIDGTDMRTIALKCMTPAFLPDECYALVARSDVTHNRIEDSEDLVNLPMDEYAAVIPEHFGRAIVIGDAAHPTVTSPLGNLGMSLGINDAVLLAKLLGKYLNPHSTARDGANLNTLSLEFDTLRVATCNHLMKEARCSGPFTQVESAITRSLLSFTRKYAYQTGDNLYQALYEQDMIQNVSDYIVLSPPR
jgi:2-polyprenyl-6-methoxyphenol hydroxylase-like FAD-dependent oxidoreductase